MLKLAILVTNIDLSDFAHRHPFDGEKFTQLIHSVRPDWSCEVFLVHQDEFPAQIDQFDGVMITGSPASVHDDLPWIARLMDLIRTIEAQKIPLYGACFGHQAIAMALGGTVAENPCGWVFGLEQATLAPQAAQNAPWMAPLGTGHKQFAAHIEQVTQLPSGARSLSSTQGVACSGFAIGSHVYTSQNHPEMDAAFFAALIEEYGPKLGEATSAKARASLQHSADTQAYAETIARFFESQS